MPICAGGIISEYDILTNAVCASACQHPPYCKLYVGRANVDTGGVEVKISSTTWHHSYLEMDLIDQSKRNDPDLSLSHRFTDLGIIHTERIPLSDTVQIIELAKFEDLCNKTIGYFVGLYGWGSEKFANFVDEPKACENFGQMSFLNTKLVSSIPFNDI